MSKNDTLTIISDHSCTLRNLIDAFRKEKCNIECEEENGIWKIYIKKL
ncbi:sulfurtransferase TusA family protein [Caloramator sp. Dgby_cultured_2]